MKRMLCILTATIILAVFMTGCGCSDQGKIGNGTNGTYTDNANDNGNTNGDNGNSMDNNANSNANGNNTADNGNNNNGSSSSSNTTDNSSSTDNNSGLDDNSNNNTNDATQEGIAGRMGDAIDQGIDGIEDGLTGNDNNTQSMR